jgi:membrane-associated phospholipid phosphatase
MKLWLCCIAALWFTITGTKAQKADIYLLRQINSGPQSADGAMNFFSNSTVVVSAVAPMSMLVASWFNHDHALRLKAYETAGAVVLSQAIPFGLKHIINRPRPYLAQPYLFTGKVDETGSSFPSAHASMAFATATALSINFPKWYVIVPAYSYAAMVGYARMYQGVHYPSDVLAGALIGSGSAILTHKLNRLFNKKVVKLAPPPGE